MSLAFTLFILFSNVVSCISTKKRGFSTKLYHRHGPGTPFYDPNLTEMDRVNKGIDRDLTRANRSRTITSNSPITDLSEVEGQYLMKLSIGTPPYEFFGVADTRSEMTWIQCEPCQHCYSQNYPIFEPNNSSTYRKKMCIYDVLSCPPFHSVNCINHVCMYQMCYDDNRFSIGVLSTDTMTIQSTTCHPVKVTKYMFGCGHYNEGKFKRQTAGIIGLGVGKRSLIYQLDEYGQGKFSYCLARNKEGGKVNFGDNAVLRGPGVITTSIADTGRDEEAFFLATLEGLTIGTERVDYYTDYGRLVIDTGATVTIFPKEFYEKVVDSVTRQIKTQRIPDPSTRFEVCYENINDSFQSIPITAHFSGRADVVLNTFNMFLTTEHGVICLIIQHGPRGIWGSTAQTDFFIAFDVAARTMSFQPLALAG